VIRVTEVEILNGIEAAGIGLLIVGFGWLSVNMGRHFAKPERVFRDTADAILDGSRKFLYYLLLGPQALVVAFVIAGLIGNPDFRCGDLSHKCDGRVYFFFMILTFHFVMSCYGAKALLDEFTKFIADRGHSPEAFAEWKKYPKPGFVTWRSGY
jgi:hypothetical protein